MLENNRIENVFINVRPGTKHLAIRNNVVKVDGLQAIQLETVQGIFTDLVMDDIRIDHNTAINMSTVGSFLRVDGHASNIVLDNNLYVGPTSSPPAEDRQARCTLPMPI